MFREQNVPCHDKVGRMGTILFYNTQKEKAARVRNALALTGVRVLEVTPGQELLPIGILAGEDAPDGDVFRQTAQRNTPAQPQTPSQPPVLAPIPMPIREPMGVIAVESEAMFDHVIAMLRSCGMQGLLKAVVTPVNQSWNGRQLYAELCAERRAVERQADKRRAVERQADKRRAAERGAAERRKSK